MAVSKASNQIHTKKATIILLYDLTEEGVLRSKDMSV
jgi:hypothetical protein